MAYNAVALAKYIVSYCSSKRKPISNLKLQKMLYFMWIDYYKETKTPLFTEAICAWQLGPVIPEVYYEFCSYAGMSITRTTAKVALPSGEISIINRLIERYIDISARSLVERSHRANGPWALIYRSGGGTRKVIPFPLICKLECETNAVRGITT